jgi:His/Glu/Gln/Arg/opine family amino acid ABC transporter permease subunit
MQGWCLNAPALCIFMFILSGKGDSAMFSSGEWVKIPKLLPLLFEGALVSLEIFFLTLIFSLPLGLLVALGRKSKSRWISEPIKWYILVMRGTPLILQIFIINYAPYYMFRLNLERFLAAIIGFSLNYAAYFAEIYRGGIESISQGQYEAAAVLGFTRSQTFFSYHFASGRKEGTSTHQQRNYHLGERYSFSHGSGYLRAVPCGKKSSKCSFFDYPFIRSRLVLSCHELGGYEGSSFH